MSLQSLPSIDTANEKDFFQMFANKSLSIFKHLHLKLFHNAIQILTKYPIIHFVGLILQLIFFPKTSTDLNQI